MTRGGPERRLRRPTASPPVERARGSPATLHATPPRPLWPRGALIVGHRRSVDAHPASRTWGSPAAPRAPARGRGGQGAAPRPPTPSHGRVEVRRRLAFRAATPPAHRGWRRPPDSPIERIFVVPSDPPCRGARRHGQPLRGFSVPASTWHATSTPPHPSCQPKRDAKETAMNCRARGTGERDNQPKVSLKASSSLFQKLPSRSNQKQSHVVVGVPVAS